MSIDTFSKLSMSWCVLSCGQCAARGIETQAALSSMMLGAHMGEKPPKVLTGDMDALSILSLIHI